MHMPKVYINKAHLLWVACLALFILSLWHFNLTPLDVLFGDTAPFSDAFAQHFWATLFLIMLVLIPVWEEFKD